MAALTAELDRALVASGLPRAGAVQGTG